MLKILFVILYIYVLNCFSILKSSFIDINIYKEKINEVESDINIV